MAKRGKRVRRAMMPAVRCKQPHAPGRTAVIKKASGPNCLIGCTNEYTFRISITASQAGGRARPATTVREHHAATTSEG